MKIFKWKKKGSEKFDIPETLDTFIGKTLILKDGTEVKVETIVGNRWTPNFFEVNGKHLIGMLRAYKQLYKDSSITEDQLTEFEKIEHYVEKVPEKRSALQVQAAIEHLKYKLQLVEDTHGKTKEDGSSGTNDGAKPEG